MAETRVVSSICVQAATPFIKEENKSLLTVVAVRVSISLVVGYCGFQFCKACLTSFIYRSHESHNLTDNAEFDETVHIEMIESCTKKRMLIGITLLGGLTVLVLIVESHWTDNPGKLFLESFENNTKCISEDAYEITSECQPCSAFEVASRSIDVCIRARYKEVLKCKSGETITRSCDRVAWLEERAFWKFEAFMFLLASSSCISVYWRENVLRQRIIRKVAKQLRASV